MVDLISIFLRAGNGGDGHMSFHSTRYQLRGGPDGGNGGNGGSIILQANRNLHSLRDYTGKLKIEAQDGTAGGSSKMSGANASDTILNVPIGTSVWRLPEDFAPKKPKHMYTIDQEGVRREWELVRRKKNLSDKDSQATIISVGVNPPQLGKKLLIGKKLVNVEWVGEVTQDGQQLRVVGGGRGGRGNFEFRSSTHTTPREAETGQGGESGTFYFELQILADLGLVGFPNAGKSTLLSVLTTAKPQIADYPFTTLEPNLGILEYASHRGDQKASFVMADIPGIIEGAGMGKGLGTAFLRHIERTRALLFVLALEDYEVLDAKGDALLLVNKLARQYEQLQKELASYDASLELYGKNVERVAAVYKKRLVVINKSDLYSDDLIAKLKRALQKKIGKHLFVSAKTSKNLDELKTNLRFLLAD